MSTPCRLLRQMVTERTIGMALIPAALLAAGAVPVNASSPADLVITHATIVTLDEQCPRAEALAIKGDLIVAVGSNERIGQEIGAQTRVLELNGHLVIPGFIESHAHFTGVGRARQRIDLTAARDWEEIVALVAEASTSVPPGEWILGRGWHQEKWRRIPDAHVDGLPYHHALSRAVPEHPVLLTHASGHAVIANAKAMELAGITAASRDPEGGTIVRGADGQPIGVFRETAEEALEKAFETHRAKWTAAQREAELQQIVALATEECLSHGITTFCDAGANFETIEAYKTAIKADRLGVRLWVMISEDNEMLAESLADYKIIGWGRNHLTVRAIKRILDGALGSHGAWLLEPYDDLPGSSGLNTEPLSALAETAQLAIDHGFQLCTHAIGDRANRELLDLYERILREHPQKKDARWRIEHAQHLDVRDIPRFAELGIIAAMQTCHCTSDGPWVPRRIGARRASAGAYVWRSLLTAGTMICNGTDAPVEDLDPLTNYYAAVTRKMADGSAFYPEQCMTRAEALRSYTINGAYAAFEEDVKGSLTPGKLADITVIDRDITTIPAEEILKAVVVYTIVGGEIRYRR